MERLRKLNTEKCNQ